MMKELWKYFLKWVGYAVVGIGLGVVFCSVALAEPVHPNDVRDFRSLQRYLFDAEFPGDVTFRGADSASDGAGEHLIWDSSVYTLFLQDNTELGFGNTSSAPDIWMRWDGTNFDILTTLTDETAAVNLGVDQAGVDFQLFGATANAAALWDASDDALELNSGAFLVFGPVSADPTGTTEGAVYYDSDDDNLYVRTTAGLVDLTASAASGTLDAAYDSGGAGAGRTITADTGAVVINNTDSDVAFLLSVTPTPGGAAATGGIQITSGANSTEDSLQITNSGSGFSISTDSDVFTVANDGSIIGLDLDLTGATGLVLSNDAAITNAVDGAIKIADGGESLILTLNANTVTLSSDDGVDTLAMGAVDDLSGVGTIAFDAAASSISLAADGAADDLTIQVTGAQNSSLVLSSAGTAADALQITTTAGGIDITNGGAAGGEDIDVDAVLASLNLNADEDVADAITMVASAGGIDITADGAAASDLDLVCTNGSTNISGGEAIADAVTIAAGAGGVDITSAATFDIDITATGGKVNIQGNENAASSVAINTQAGGGALETIHISNDNGTSVTENAAAIQLAADAGGISLKSTANLAKAIQIVADGGATESIYVQADQGTAASASTETDAAIQLVADVGGIGLYSGLNAADSIRIEANGGASEEINISSVQGTGVASIDIDSALGGITISANAAGKDVEIDSVLGSINIEAEEDVANAILITADGGVSSTLRLHNDTGTGAASIDLLSDVGGITLTSSAGPVAINATGAAAGDYTATIGDEYILDVEGGIAIDSNEAAADAIGLTASNAAGGITMNVGTGDISCSGDVFKAFSLDVVDDIDGKTLTTSESGTVQTNAGAAGAAAWTLPSAAAGLHYKFIVMAAQELRVTPAAGDRIYYGSTAMALAEYYYASAVGSSLTLVAVDATNWIMLSSTGTWAEQTP